MSLTFYSMDLLQIKTEAQTLPIFFNSTQTADISLCEILKVSQDRWQKETTVRTNHVNERIRVGKQALLFQFLVKQKYIEYGLYYNILHVLDIKRSG